MNFYKKNLISIMNLFLQNKRPTKIQKLDFRGFHGGGEARPLKSTNKFHFILVCNILHINNFAYKINLIIYHCIWRIFLITF